MDELFAIGAKCLLASKGAELQEEDLEMSGFNPKMERLSPKKTGNLLEEAQGSPGVQISFLKGNLARRLLRLSLFTPELCPSRPRCIAGSRAAGYFLLVCYLERQPAVHSPWPPPGQEP